MKLGNETTKYIYIIRDIDSFEDETELFEEMLMTGMKFVHSIILPSNNIRYYFETQNR